MNAVEQFRSEPRVKKLFTPSVFVHLVRKNCNTKTCEQIIRNYLKPLVVPLELWPVIKDCWSVTADSLPDSCKTDHQRGDKSTDEGEQH